MFCERYESELGDDATTLRKAAALTGTWGAVATGVLTLVHGDYRLDNLMFPEAHDRAGDGVFAVDWQTLAIAPPGTRSGLLPRHQPPCRRPPRAHQDTLVAAYADEVRRLGVADCTVEQCDHEYRLGVLQAPMITMIGAAYATAGRSASADAMFLAMATRAAQLSATSTRSPWSNRRTRRRQPSRYARTRRRVR